ncbi:hypothetical protein [Radiobacillus deserti]|uniref:Uncharacterized protein n=1 Tax=Radiobacillus deserti TaxID=2594883 RepID=A0A516KHU9_9BACI|nr:hypothetical protein [Radiobacillus deserti]QDP40964.1 hypothetical protein FN924_12660 [Radiobacillus deserti]
MYHFRHPYSYREHPIFPQVQTHQFETSAKTCQVVMKDLDTLLQNIEHNQGFAYKIKDAAQKSNTSQIKTYINELGISTVPEVKYNPDGIQFIFTAKRTQIETCKLTLSIPW